MFELLMCVCVWYLVRSPVHPSLSTWVDVDEQQTLYHVRVVQLKHTKHEICDLLLKHTTLHLARYMCKKQAQAANVWAILKP